MIYIKNVDRKQINNSIVYKLKKGAVTGFLTTSLLTMGLVGCGKQEVEDTSLSTTYSYSDQDAFKQRNSFNDEPLYVNDSFAVKYDENEIGKIINELFAYDDRDVADIIPKIRKLLDILEIVYCGFACVFAAYAIKKVVKDQFNNSFDDVKKMIKKRKDDFENNTKK
jgi:hydrogenase maturation factor HypE